MNSWIKCGCLLVLAAILGQSLPVMASGTYCVCITKPPSKQLRVDRDKYDQGQKIFNGKTKLALTATKAEEQKERLASLQGLLPKRTAKKTDLPSLAGRLSEEQLQALEYYVHQRYGKEK